MEEEIRQIPSSFDDFLNPQPPKSDSAKDETLYSRFEKERMEWSAKVKGMSYKLKDVFQVAELMTYLYTERQRALEYYHYLISLLIKINKAYRKSYSEKHDFYTYKSQQRFPNETTKSNHIQAELGDILEKRDMLDNHSKFILGTISTMDNIIYAIKSRIEIDNISRGK